MRIVGGERERVGLWMLDKLPDLMDLPGGFEAIGVERGGELVGGCMYTDWHPCKGGGTIQLWGAGNTGWISRRVISVMFGYPFNPPPHGLGCHRITALAEKSNKRSRKVLEDLGFRLEGVARQGFGPRRHACLYSLLRDEQGWV